MKTAIAQIAIVLGVQFLYALYFQLAWNWHVLPILGWELGYAEAWGLIAVVGLIVPIGLTAEVVADDEVKAANGPWGGFLYARSLYFGYHTMLFLFAWIAAFFV